MEGGLSIEASVDFTGGIPEVINLTQLNETDKKALFDYMKECFHIIFIFFHYTLIISVNTFGSKTSAGKYDFLGPYLK